MVSDKKVANVLQRAEEHVKAYGDDSRSALRGVVFEFEGMGRWF